MHGPHEQDLIKLCIQQKRPLPDFIANAPELKPGLEFYIEAFWELHTCRSIGMDVGPIPWTAVQTYGTIHLDTAQEIFELHYLIRAMDHKYQEVRAEQHKELAK